MQNQPSAGVGFSLVPLMPQQFYQMAQHHATVNATFAPSAYLPQHEPEAYASVPSGHYSVPQHMVHPDPYAAADATPYWSAPALAYEALPRSYAPYDPSLLLGHVHAPTATYVSPAASASAPVAATNVAASVSASTAPIASASSSVDHSSELVSDAPLADEHKWRKYGQKQVKRSPYPRNYYKCTVSGCPAKKHLEKFWDPALNRERCRTIYLGEHVHPVAVSPQVFATSQSDFQTNVLAQSARIRASSESSPATTVADLASQQRLVVECGTHVDENEDGYSWRKYGQKSVKGSVTPRQYYRCRVGGCPVKKTVEASLKGNTIVTYDGCHNHEPGAMCSTPSSDLASCPTSPQTAAAAASLGYVAHYSPYAAVSSPASTSVTSPVSAPLSPLVTSRSASIASTDASYATQAVYSPVSYSGTSTDDDNDDSYLSEPSPKRFVKVEDANADVPHSFVPGMPSADIWYASWDNELMLTH